MHRLRLLLFARVQASYADGISIFDFNMRPGPSVFPRPDCPAGTPAASCTRGTNPGRTHRFFVGDAVVPFGFGLSYTTFTYHVTASARAISLEPLRALLAGPPGDAAEPRRSGVFVRTSDAEAAGAGAGAVGYTVTVTNTGTVDADDVVLGFLVPPGAGTNGVPLQTLFGFERVYVPAGESRVVSLYPMLTEFAATGRDGKGTALPGTYRVRFGLHESRDLGMGFAETTLVAA